MIFSQLKVLRSHGQQSIKDLNAVQLPDRFRGMLCLKSTPEPRILEDLVQLCPSGAILDAPFGVDMGRCLFCGECAFLHPEVFDFRPHYHTATPCREALVITPDSPPIMPFDMARVRQQIGKVFGRALKLREVSAGGSNATEMELNSSMNVNFDFLRYGVEFVASPRHADGIVITGPITENMAIPLELCYHAIATPKLIILAGTDAISGGVFAQSAALERGFLSRFQVDLYIPGNPVHPLAFIDGILTLLGHRHR